MPRSSTTRSSGQTFSAIVSFTRWPEKSAGSRPAAWRIPASKFTSTIRSLPIGTGRTVKLTQEGGGLSLVSGRTRGRVAMILAEGYPMWEDYDETDSVPVSNFGERLAQIEWACDKKADPFTGIYLDGTHMWATNGRRAACVPCEIPLIQGTPITVPVGPLTPILRNAGDVLMGSWGNFLTISPDKHTQIRSTIFDQGIPDPTRAFGRMEFEHRTVVSRDAVVEAIQRMVNVVKGPDVVPVVKVFIGAGAMTLRSEAPDGDDWIEDTIGLDGQADHLPVMMSFVAQNVVDSVGKSPDEKVALCYNQSGNKIVHVDGGGGYRTWFVQTMGGGK